MASFGDYVKNLRIQNKLTLRAFCKQVSFDPSNWSKIERNILSPPKSKMILQEIATVLNLKTKSDEWNTLFELSAIGHIPKGLLDDSSVLEKLPIFFRTIRGEKPNRAELEELINLLRDDQ